MNDDETKQLLREIRDLQKAHSDRYSQVTEQMLRLQRRMIHVLFPVLVILLVLFVPLLLYLLTTIILSFATPTR